MCFQASKEVVIGETKWKLPEAGTSPSVMLPNIASTLWMVDVMLGADSDDQSQTSDQP